MSHQFRQAAADYLAIRRGLGFKLQGYDRLLADFLGYLERSGASTITVQAAVAWATAPAGASAGRWSDRLGAVRGLARHLQGIDSSVEVPPLELIACRRQRRTPYLYSPSDITRLVGAAASLRPALRGATYEALFGLLSCTGMRVGETIALDRGDVDLRAGELEINDAKFRKHRRLPLHGSTVAALRRYAALLCAPTPPCRRNGHLHTVTMTTPLGGHGRRENESMARLRESKEMLLFVFSTVLLLAGGAAWLLAAGTPARVLWIAGTVLGLVFSVSWTVGAIRRHQPSVDVIAVLALAGALAVGEPFAGAVITVMLASGRLLEARASARARRELSLLVERAPRTARRRVEGGVVEVPVDDVVPGDRLLVGAGGIVPVDGRLLTPAVLDESALTGESRPAERIAGEDVRSGVVNAGQPIDLVATAAAAESTYAGVVRLVEQAQASSAPFVRAADRFAVLFVPVTLVLAAAAWALSADPVRAVAVLVVATPCPLLLAAPIAIMSGLSRAAHIGVVIKGGGALERLAAGQVMLFDKTGTLTQGRPGLADVVTAGGRMDADELLRLAASLDQVSAHVLASAIVTAAASRGLALEMPAEVREVHGYGLEGTVGIHRVRLGKAAWIVGGEPPLWVRQVRRRADLDGSLTVFAAVDDEPAGAFLLEDPIRPDAPRMVRALREAGITRVVLVTGDRADIADMVGRVVGVDSVLADCDPADKLAAIERESAHGATIMVGDGVNDAPALAAAGARGGPRRARGHRVIRGGRRRSHGRPGRRPGRRDPHRAPLEGDRPAGRPHRHGLVARGDGRRRGRAPPAGGGRAPARGHRRAGDRHRPAGSATRCDPHDRDAARRRRHRAPPAGRARRRAAGGRADPVGG